MRHSGYVATIVVTGLLGALGCQTSSNYDKAFSAKSAIAGNTRSYPLPVDQTFRAARVTLIQRGFSIDQEDAASGLLRGSRTLPDPSHKKVSFVVSTTIDVSPAPAGNATMVTMSATQQTVLHDSTTKYYNLLGMVAIPTGREHTTTVKKEGTIGSPEFYKDFFDALQGNVSQVAVVTTPLPDAHVGVPTPLAAPPSAAPNAAAPTAAPAPPVVLAETAAPSDVAPATAAPAPSSTPAAATPAKGDDAPALETLANPFAKPATDDKPQ
jgi:hypothetical protein